MIFNKEQWVIIEHGLKKREVIIVQLPMYSPVAIDLKIKELRENGRKGADMHKAIVWDIVKIAARDGGFFRKLKKQAIRREVNPADVKGYQIAANNLQRLLSITIPRRFEL